MELQRPKSFEEIIDYYHENNFEQSKLKAFALTDFAVNEDKQLMKLLVELVNKTIFIKSKLMVPIDARDVIGNVYGIFNYEFCYYFTVHQMYDEMFNKYMEYVHNANTLEELKQATIHVMVFTGAFMDKHEKPVKPQTSRFAIEEELENSHLTAPTSSKNDHKNNVSEIIHIFHDNFEELDDAIRTKSHSKLNELKEAIEEALEYLYCESPKEINSVTEFVTVNDNMYYDRSFLLYAHDILDETFSCFGKELSANEKFIFLCKMFIDGTYPISLNELTREIYEMSETYITAILNKEKQRFTLTADFWTDFCNSIVCYMIMFAKEASQEAMLSTKNMKLRVKSNTIIDIMKNLVPRHEIMTVAQMNFLQWITKSQQQVQMIVNKKFGIRTGAETIDDKIKQRIAVETYEAVHEQITKDQNEANEQGKQLTKRYKKSEGAFKPLENDPFAVNTKTEKEEVEVFDVVEQLRQVDKPSSTKVIKFVKNESEDDEYILDDEESNDPEEDPEEDLEDDFEDSF